MPMLIVRISCLYMSPMISGERRSADRRPTHRPMICGSFKYDIGRLIGRSSADHRPIMIGRFPKPQNCRPMEKMFNKVVIIFFFRLMKKELKSVILSADKLADCRPTVGEFNVISFLGTHLQLNVFTFNNVYLSIKIYSSLHLVILQHQYLRL